MSYDNPIQVDYSFTNIVLTGAPVARYLRIPYGLQQGRGAAGSAGNPAGTSIRFARVREMAISGVVACTGTTLAGRLNVGTAATAGKYCIQKIGIDGQATALAAPGAWGFVDYDGLIAPYTNRVDLLNDGDAAGTFQQFLSVNFAAPTGGTPAGTIDFTVSVQYW